MTDPNQIASSEQREAFEAWARHNIGQFSPAGYHGTGGVWVYRHNIQQTMWLCWRAAVRAIIEEHSNGK